MHRKQFLTAGLAVEKASRALVMLHGRGAGAEDILSLSAYLPVADFALIAPQATNRTWYPYSFLAPPAQNEPWLSSALDMIGQLTGDLTMKGIPAEKIFFLGFSQGACLTLEYTARHPRRYGGIIAFTGGLIGDKLDQGRYQGRFAGTPLFTGTSNPDPHVPLERALASAALFEDMGAEVIQKTYPGMGHTINEDELRHAGEILQNKYRADPAPVQSA